jgi:hypothetical protein
MIEDRQALLDSALPEVELKELHGHVNTGRPLGNEWFLERLEQMLGRDLIPKKGGRPKSKNSIVSPDYQIKITPPLTSYIRTTTLNGIGKSNFLSLPVRNSPELRHYVTDHPCGGNQISYHLSFTYACPGNRRFS